MGSSNWKRNFKLRLFEKQNGLCPYCGAAMKLTAASQSDPLVATIDHVRPIKLGGSNKITNKTLCCFTCNQLKGDLPMLEFFAKLKEIKNGL